jgi:hypothetical protein
VAQAGDMVEVLQLYYKNWVVSTNSFLWFCPCLQLEWGFYLQVEVVVLVFYQFKER